MSRNRRSHVKRAKVLACAWHQMNFDTAGAETGLYVSNAKSDRAIPMRAKRFKGQALFPLRGWKCRTLANAIRGGYPK